MSKHRTFVNLLIALALAAAGVVGAGPARAQSAPQGNAHPRPEAVSAVGVSNPFGAPGPTSFDTARKGAFAGAVDLSPLRDLAVYHSGRVKIVDTLARETVRELMGRFDYQDIVVDVKDATKTTRVKYDPLFTFVDLIIDPGYYVDRPLIHVEFLPLREALLERMYESKEEREWWKRLGRLKPILLAKHLEEVTAQHQFEAGFPRALSDVRTGLLLYQNSWQNLLMVAADQDNEPWSHLATLPEGSAAGRAVREMGAAWRAGDAARVNAAVRTLADELPKINAAQYPRARRGLEAAYNRAHAFEWGAWMYALALITLLLAFGTHRRWLAWAGCAALVAAVGMHGFGFVSRCIIAERFAIQNQFESMTGLSLFATLVGLGIMLLRRQWLFGAAAAGVGFMILITATQTGIPGKVVEREAPILNTSVLLKYHVTTVLVSYGLIALGFMVSLFYLGTHYMARAKGALAGPKLAAAGGGEGVALADVSAEALGLGGGNGAGGGGAARVLHDLDKAQMIILQLAFWTLGVGILLGAWWADHSWGRWWAFDPKELWALVTWIVYLIVIHLRFAQVRDRGLTTAWLSVLGFFVMLWTYFGVNLLLPGLHAYA